MNRSFLYKNFGSLALLAVLVAFPFVLALVTGEPLNKGTPLFAQGLMVQVYILAVFALSYDILMGHIGILSFGHALFFGTGAYTVGILLKYAHWSLPAAIGAVILIESTISFLGFGIPPPIPTWGQMLSGNIQRFANRAPLVAFWPGLAISLAVFGFNMFGDALRDVLDPRLRGSR